MFMILGSIVVATYSRFREFRADAGGARLAGRDKMIGALHALERTIEIHDPKVWTASSSSLKISGHSRFLRIFSVTRH